MSHSRKIVTKESAGAQASRLERSGGYDWNAASGGCDWSAGIAACMSAKHEKRRAYRDMQSLTPLKNATLQAGMPSLQSHPPQSHPPALELLASIRVRAL